MFSEPGSVVGSNLNKPLTIVEPETFREPVIVVLPMTFNDPLFCAFVVNIS